MGAQFSKKTDDGVGAPLPDLSSYEAACRLDPELQRFDVTLQERTSRVINTLAVGMEVRSLSLESLREVTACLLEMNQEVVKVVLDSKKDIWNTPELFDVAEEYFENSLQTLDFCTALERCLKQARDRQLMVQISIQQFEEEEERGPAAGEGKYQRTLRELRSFKAAGDPFTEEFFELFQSVSNQQVSMLRRLQSRKRKLDKKLRTLKVWRRVSNAILVSAVVVVLVCSVAAAAVTAPPVVAAVAAASAVPLGSMGKWVDSMWKGYEAGVKGQREVVGSMQIATLVTIKDLDGIRALVDRVEVEIASLLETADFSLREGGGDEVVRVSMGEVKKKVAAFMETMDDLCRHADKCSQDVAMARTVVLQRIIRHPGDGSL